MLFKDLLKELREERNFTQKQVALACDVTPTCICQLETGARSPTGSTLMALADFFDCSIDYLMGRSEKNYNGLNFAPSPPIEMLSKEEKTLLEAYRQLDLRGKIHLEEYAKLRLEELKGSSSRRA